MVFRLHGLDSSMKTLLIYALNPEAGLLKQQFPNISVKVAHQGMELLTTNDNFDLLRTGIGLQRAQAAMRHITRPQIYDQIIHFGVSGSLADSLPVRSIIKGHRFTAKDHDPIELNSALSPAVDSVTFYSSVDVVSDELSRKTASAGGAMAVDMESYAIAEFCKKNKLALLALRIISDRAGSSTPEEFRKNFKSASHELQKYIIEHIL